MIKNLYHKIFVQNLKLILKEIKLENNSDNYCIHITFKTDNISLPDWLKKKYPGYMTVILQNHFHDLIIEKQSFKVTLFFSNIPVEISIPFNNIVSISDIKFGFLSAYDSTINLDDKQSKFTNIKIVNFEDLKRS